MIIGLCGYAGSGKTTISQHLVDTYDFERVRFAGPLKDMARACGLSEEQVDGNLKEVPDDNLLCGKTPREFMQRLGTEFGRMQIHPDFWVRAWMRRVEELPLDCIVADDVRFANEAKAIRDMGGTIIKIERPGVTIGSHISEAMPFTPDVTIGNYGEVVDLLQEINWLALNVWKLQAAA